MHQSPLVWIKPGHELYNTEQSLILKQGSTSIDHELMEAMDICHLHIWPHKTIQGIIKLIWIVWQVFLTCQGMILNRLCLLERSPNQLMTPLKPKFSIINHLQKSWCTYHWIILLDAFWKSANPVLLPHTFLKLVTWLFMVHVVSSLMWIKLFKHACINVNNFGIL